MRFVCAILWQQLSLPAWIRSSAMTADDVAAVGAQSIVVSSVLVSTECVAVRCICQSCSCRVHPVGVSVLSGTLAPLYSVGGMQAACTG